MRVAVSLEDTDKQMTIRHQAGTLVFEGVQSDARGGDVNYVRVRGPVSGVKKPSGEGGALRFTFTINDTGAQGKADLPAPHYGRSRRSQGGRP